MIYIIALLDAARPKHLSVGDNLLIVARRITRAIIVTLGMTTESSFLFPSLAVSSYDSVTYLFLDTRFYLII